MQHSAIFAALIAAVNARIVTVEDVTTAAPTTVYQTQSAAVVTDDETAYASETIFEASTIVTTIPTGSVDTQPVSTKSAPVTQQDSYSTSQLTTTIDPSTYTSGFVVIEPTTSSEAAQPTSSASSASSSAPLVSSASSSLNAPSSSSQSLTSKGSRTTSSNAYQTPSHRSHGGSSSSSSSASRPFSSDVTSAQASSTSSSSSSSSAVQTSAPKPATGGSYSGPIFDAIDTSAPLNMFSQEPIPLTLAERVDKSGPIQTNKFYDNLLLDDQTLTSFAQPYDVFYSTDQDYYGWGISYSNASQRVFGPDPNADPVEYYTNPLGVKSLVLSAKEFTSQNLNKPEVSAFGPFSANVTLSTYNNYPGQSLQLPTAIGMGFVTGIYDGYTPRLFSQIGIKKIVEAKHSKCADGIVKYVLTLMNGIQWNVYVRAPSGFEFKAVSDFEVMGNFAASGADSIILQVAVVTGSEDAIDSAAGAYPVGAEIDGEAAGTSVTYRIEYDVRGTSSSGTTLLYALPHLIESFSGKTKNAAVPDLTVYSPGKGYLGGVLSNSLEMVEDVSDIPGWLPGKGSQISADELKLISSVVNDEISEDIFGQVDTTSTYTAGKAFDKFAYIALVAQLVLKNNEVAKEGLDRLKKALDPWLSNSQPTPFIYDTLCKGITSSAANKAGGSSMDDFGAPFYNDHHFHYGYYVHTAAVIGLLDKHIGDGTWINQHKDWVNSLVRDVANPSTEDSYFPVSRMFDFFSGHSWAHGMFASGDGKDEESTSEDYNFAYGMKLWGQVIGDKQMELRGDLMLAILKRSLNKYFLFSDGNSIEPQQILGNRVAGITFENKLDHTTYFGTNLEYIQGIQMLPLTPASVLIRGSTFPEQEWNSLLAPIVGNLDSGWAGVLRANQALFDPTTSYNWFASDSFKTSYLDGGASRSWYLTFAALLAGQH